MVRRGVAGDLVRLRAETRWWWLRRGKRAAKFEVIQDSEATVIAAPGPRPRPQFLNEERVSEVRFEQVRQTRYGAVSIGIGYSGTATAVWRSR